MTLTGSGTERSNNSHSIDIAYLPGLDGIRAFAVISVMLYHAGYPVVGGYLGVESFFVLSGFLITTLLGAEWQQYGRIDIPLFWLRRARRLLPALLALLVGTCFLAAVLLPSALGALGADSLAALFYVMNWKLVAAQQSYFDPFNRPPLLQHLWSLAIEEQFYLFWPLVFALGMRVLRPLGLLLALVVTAVASAALMFSLYDPGSDPSRIYYGTDTRASALFIGAALALIWTPTRKHALVGRWATLLEVVGFGALVGLLLAYGFMREQLPLLYSGGLPLVSLATALVIAATTAPGTRLLVKLLEWFPLRWIGLRSYSLYLWHWPLFQLAEPQLNGLVAPWLATLVCFALTVGLAAASYRFVEQPIRSAEFAKTWGNLRAALSLRGARRHALPLALGSACVIAAGLLLFLRQPMQAASLSEAAPALAASVAATPARQAPRPQPTSTTSELVAATSVPCAEDAERRPCVNTTPSVVPTTVPAGPPLDPALAADLQGLLDETVANRYISGVVLSVSIPEHAPWTGASGIADRANGVAMTPNTPVRIASVSKMFTAVVVLQLVEEGVLALDAPVATWLPDSVPNAERITIEQLLQHTTGLYDYLEDLDIVEQMRRDPEREWQPQELVDYAAQFPSGALGRWDYASTNYVLLGMVVEQATGEPLAQQIRQRIFEPLGMTQAAFLPQDPVPDNLARGYSDQTDITDASMSFAFATGNLAMTVEELHRFGRALFNEDLLQTETREVMLQFISGRGQYGMPELAYGLGVMRNRLALGNAPGGQQRTAEAALVLGHIGGYGGFRSAIWYAPDSDVVIAIGLNQSQADPNDLAAPVLDRVLAALGR